MRERGFSFQTPTESWRREASGWFPRKPVATLWVFILPTSEKITRRCEMSHLIKLADELNICRSKISFISDFFSDRSPVEFSDHSQFGLSFILDDVMDSLNLISEEIATMIKDDHSQGAVVRVQNEI